MGASARRLPVRTSRRRAVLLALALAVACMVLGPPRAAAASRHGAALTVATTGLPAGQPASIVIAGPGLHRRLTAARTTLAGLRAGRYVLSVSPVVIARSRRAVSAGARAYPARRRVSVTLRGSVRRSLTVRYAAIVNPNVRRAPPVLSLTGEPRDPAAIVIAASSGRPAVGAILTSGPTGTLPLGLLAKVTAVSRSGSTLRVSLTTAAATPLRLWEPPVDLLVIATTARFTTDAVQWIEKFNQDGRTEIVPWADSHLELLLAGRPQIADEFGLTA